MLFYAGCQKTGKRGCVDIGHEWGNKYGCLKYTCKKDKDREGKDTTRVNKEQGNNAITPKVAV